MQRRVRAERGDVDRGLPPERDPNDGDDALDAYPDTRADAEANAYPDSDLDADSRRSRAHKRAKSRADSLRKKRRLVGRRSGR